MRHLPPDPQQAAPVAKIPAASALQGPRLPVTRWNRRYLLAGGAAIAAIVASAFYIGFGGADRPATRKEGQGPPTDATPAASAFADRYPKGYGDPAVRAAAPGTVSLPPPGAPVAQSAATPPAPPRQVDPAIQLAQAQAQAARSASPFFQVSGPEGSSAAAPTPTFALAAPATAPATSAAAAAAEGSWPDVQPSNGQGAKRTFVQTAKTDDYLQTPLREPESPWEVKAGTVIPAALLTAINSDLPGEIIAQVTEPVYDHVSGRTVLIPQGSRLVGQYDSQIAYGQERALIAWNRIVMPNGRSINLGSMEGADLSGASGLHDQVDGHVWQLARGILLSSVFSIGASEAQDASARSSGSLVLNSAGTGVANEAEQVGSQITSRDLNRQPTIQVRAGWPLRVLVNKDMILAPYP